MATTYELFNEVEVLQLKLSLWQTRLLHAKGVRRTECAAAVADLQARIAAVREP